jgi:hypothetical protein
LQSSLPGGGSFLHENRARRRGTQDNLHCLLKNGSIGCGMPDLKYPLMHHPERPRKPSLLVE